MFACDQVADQSAATAGCKAYLAYDSDDNACQTCTVHASIGLAVADICTWCGRRAGVRQPESYINTTVSNTARSTNVARYYGSSALLLLPAL